MYDELESRIVLPSEGSLYRESKPHSKHDYSVIHRLVEKYPDDGDLQGLLKDEYDRIKIPWLAVSGWGSLLNKYPESPQLACYLANAYVEHGDPSKTMPGLYSIVAKQPDNKEFQAQLAQEYEKANDPSRMIEGWKGLVMQHPRSATLLDQLSQALMNLEDFELEMATWWDLLKSHPLNMSILRCFWVACCKKPRNPLEAATAEVLASHFTYFACLCFLNLIADHLQKYGIEDIDWWPLAHEDHLMLIRPYMVKVEWSSVLLTSI
jgi:hypothetical protein